MLKRPEEHVQSHGPGVTAVCDHPSVVVKSQTGVLGERRETQTQTDRQIDRVCHVSHGVLGLLLSSRPGSGPKEQSETGVSSPQSNRLTLFPTGRTFTYLRSFWELLSLLPGPTLCEIHRPGESGAFLWELS